MPMSVQELEKAVADAQLWADEEDDPRRKRQFQAMADGLRAEHAQAARAGRTTPSINSEPTSEIDEIKQRLEDLTHALTAPKTIVRDKDGRPIGVTIEPQVDRGRRAAPRSNPASRELNPEIKGALDAHQKALAKSPGPAEPADIRRKVDSLHAAATMPKKVVRDKDGKPVGIAPAPELVAKGKVH